MTENYLDIEKLKPIFELCKEFGVTEMAFDDVKFTMEPKGGSLAEIMEKANEAASSEKKPLTAQDIINNPFAGLE